MSLIHDALSRVELGAPLQYDNLGLFPLLSTAPGVADYLTLDEAMAGQCCRVSEVSEGGVVAELLFENTAQRPILLLDGEELIGAKQNRVLNLSILCAGGIKLKIPVSCVEHGRWSYRSKHFRSAGRTLYGKARAAKLRSVNASLDAGASRHSDQGEVWDHIADKLARLAASSATGAAEAIYATARPLTQAFVDRLTPLDRQVGAVFVIDRQVAGLELFDAPATYARVCPKLVESFALDAVDTDRRSTAKVDAGTVRWFLDRILEVEPRRFKALGLGDDLRFETPAVAGAGLEVDGRLVHLCAFAAEPAADQDLEVA